MSKSVLISIQPYWVFLIIAKTMGWNIDKEKTAEVRKNFLQAELTKGHEEAAKDFAHFLIDKAVDGNVSVSDLPDLVIEWGE